MSEDDFAKAITEKGFKFSDYELLIELGYLEFRVASLGGYKVLKDFTVNGIDLKAGMVVTHPLLKRLIIEEMASKDKYIHRL